MTATHPSALDPAPQSILPGLADLRGLTGAAARRARKSRVYNNIPDRCFEEPVVHLKGLFGSALVIADPAGVKRVLVDNVANYPRGEMQLRAFRALFGEGLLGTDGDLWRRHRRIMAPAFDPRSVTSYGPAITRACESFYPGWDAAAEGAVMDVGADMSRLALRIIAGTMFSADTDDVIGMVADTMKDGFNFNDEFNILDILPIVGPWRMTQARGADGRDVPPARRGDQPPGRSAARRADGAAADLLSRLTTARGEAGDAALSDREIRDEVVTIFIAGHETTAQALSWTWYLLSQHPAVEARLHAELDAALGGRTPTQDDLPKLPYTRRVIEESMRIYPTAPAFANRVALADDEVCGLKVKKGTSIAIAPWLLHHHRRLWDDPNRFDPDRFLPENSAGRHRFAYLPFGAGPRVCIGQMLAMNEAVLILASLAQRYELRLAPGQVVQPKADITLRPQYGLKMTLEHRRSPVG